MSASVDTAGFLNNYPLLITPLKGSHLQIISDFVFSLPHFSYAGFSTWGFLNHLTFKVL
jgi:hypothetical protein